MISAKLTESWAVNQTMQSLFEFRAVAENAYNVIQETVSKIDSILGDAKSATLDKELTGEGELVRKIFDDAKKQLDAHSEFIQWRQ